MTPLNIPDRRERLLVRAADLALAPARLRRRRPAAGPPRSIVCFRLERIGDLVMALPALAELRGAAPSAAIDLAVGSWNLEIARSIPGMRSIETLDARWLARGENGQSLSALVGAARMWRRRQYDLAINFEPDIRSNVVAAAVGASWTAGFASGGGAPLLDLALPFDTAVHTSDNLTALVRAVSRGWTAPVHAEEARLHLDEDARQRAAERLAPLRSPVVAIHVSGGRAIKQWPEDRFAAVARWLLDERHAAVVFTGSEADRSQIARVRAMLPAAPTVDGSGVGLADAAALLERCDLLVTGDTGPMHLAHAVGTPVVAVFGPSDPNRYAPRGVRDRVVRVDLACAPCNRIRRPPARCAGHTPDCLSGVSIGAVTAAVDEVLASPDTRRTDVSTVA